MASKVKKLGQLDNLPFSAQNELIRFWERSSGSKDHTRAFLDQFSRLYGNLYEQSAQRDTELFVLKVLGLAAVAADNVLAATDASEPVDRPAYGSRRRILLLVGPEGNLKPGVYRVGAKASLNADTHRWAQWFWEGRLDDYPEVEKRLNSKRPASLESGYDFVAISFVLPSRKQAAPDSAGEREQYFLSLAQSGVSGHWLPSLALEDLEPLQLRRM